MLKFETVATSYTNAKGKFHPALRTGAYIYFFVDIEYVDEDQAAAWAQLRLNDALSAAYVVVKQWDLGDAYP